MLEEKEGNKMTPLLSVIIPVYNVEKYIDRCVLSVVNQSYRNLEIFLIDDGSTDRSAELCDIWQEKDSRIRVCHKKNEGPGVARNTGIEMCVGGYLTFIDSDDWIEPDMYENMVRIARVTGCGIIGCPSIVEFGDGSQKENHSDVPEGFIDKNQCIVDFLEGNRHAWGAVHNKIYKRDVWGNTRFPAVSHLEDYVVSTKLFTETDAVYFCAKPYYHHTVNPLSLSQSGWSQGHMDMPATADRIISYLRENNSETSVIKATYRFRYLMDASVLWALYKEKPHDAAKLRKIMRSRSMEGFLGYMLHAKKKKGDLKLLVKFILSLIG